MEQYKLPTLQGTEKQIAKANEIRQLALIWRDKIFKTDAGQKMSALFIQSVTKASVWIAIPEAQNFSDAVCNFYRDMKKSESK